MKKILVAAFLGLMVVGCCKSKNANAQHRGWNDSSHSYYRSYAATVVPLIIGGTIGYGLSRPGLPMYSMPEPPPYYLYYSDPSKEPVYKQVYEYDSKCNCYAYILKQIGWR